ncbi:Multidrug resistance-associated protein 1 [Fusarium venenatum]|nr:Multidrug resistance-associated protein 1 [Fusarium venenatum]
MDEACRTTTIRSFGPLAAGCNGVFNFTLLFEETILGLLPMLLALLLGSFRLLALRRREKLLPRNLHLYLKTASWALHVALDLTLALVIALSPSVRATSASTAVSAVGIVSSLAFLWLAATEHVRSPHPSAILTLYLLASIPLDILRVRTLWFLDDSVVAAIFTTRLVLKAWLFALEMKEKRESLIKARHDFTSEETAGIINRAFLWWLNRLFLIGFRKPLVLGDIFPVDRELRFQPKDLMSQMQEDPAIIQSPKQLVKFILKGRVSLLLIGLVARCLLLGLNLAQPLLVSAVTSYLSSSERPVGQGAGLSIAYALVYVGIAVVGVLYQSNVARLMTALRGSLTALLYRRTICKTASSSTDKGVATLISADMEKVVHGFAVAHELWANPTEMAVFTWLLVKQLHVSSVAGILVMLLCIGATLTLTATASGRQAVWFESINDRVTTTINAITSIKGVKLTGNTGPVRERVSHLRDREIAQSQSFRKLLIGVFTFTYTSSIMAPVFAFGTYSILSLVRDTVPLTATVAFTSLTAFSLLSSAISSCINCVLAVVTARGSLERMQAHMSTEPCSDEYERYGSGSPYANMGEKPSNAAIMMSDVTATWNADLPPIISDISLFLPNSRLTMIIGPVGCGKTTLLNAILGEVPYATGTITLNRDELGYCSQTPWLTNATARENIIGMCDFDATWYAKVVRACGLDQDFQQLARADEAMVGSNGTTLSGGQKARIGLARLVYSRKRIAVLDDVCSGLDATTEQQVWSSLFGPTGLLAQQETTVVMATNSINNLSSADHIVVLNTEGIVAWQGTYDDFRTSDGVQAQVRDVATTNSNEDRDGEIAGIDLPAGGAVQPPISTTITEAIQSVELYKPSDKAVYMYYAKVIGWPRWAVFAVMCVVFVLGVAFPSVWIQWWTSETITRGNERLAFYLAIYASMGLAAVLAFLCASSYFMLKIVPRSARKFHSTLLETVLNAPMSFFDVVDIGETCNRFSQDLQLIDTELPLALISTTISLISCIVQFVVIIIGSNYTGIIMPFVFVAILLVQRFYLRTSRRLRILDIESRGPVLSHFLDFISGGPTIRAFRWAEQYISRANQALEECQKPFYGLAFAQQWLNLVLDLLNAGVAIIVVSTAVNTNLYSSGLTGLALFGIVGFGQNVKSFISTWTALELAMGAVARIQHLETTTASEHLPAEKETPPPDWPSAGHIVFEAVEASYRSDLPPVLKGISFQVFPGQRLGICGRTGSGKSSIVSALLRLINTSAGTIWIDDVDISTIPRNELRRRLITLPQEPFLAHGTMRSNLDPSGAHTDEELITILIKFRLWNASRLPDGLSTELTDASFSHGQRQLFCLAQATLRTDGRILIMDESTSYVDQETDELMQHLLREALPHCTTISIAHKIQTILDHDLVAVIDNGSVVELDSPAALLSREDSIFSELCRLSTAPR